MTSEHSAPLRVLATPDQHAIARPADEARARPAFPVPDNESERLRTLLDLGILHTDPSPAFDAVAELAREAFDAPIAPIALVSLVAHDYQWFKAASGLDVTSTPRDVAFCNQTIMENEPFVVRDAARDQRFADNSLVTGAPGIRFYVGHPLEIEAGHSVGSLCVIDTKPRLETLTAMNRLRALATVTVELLRQHRDKILTAKMVEEQRRQTAIIADQQREIVLQRRMLEQAAQIAKLGAWERDVSNDQISWTAGMYALHEIEPDQSPNEKTIYSMYPAKVRRRLAGIIKVAKDNNTAFEFEAPMVTAKKHRRWVRVRGGVEYVDGKPIRTFGVKQDITAEKAAARKNSFLASHDPLTGLPNRRYFNERLATMVAGLKARLRKSFAVVFIDVDDFKMTNDMHGHEAGDWLLQELARRVGKVMKPNGFVARLGGDEFGVVLPIIGEQAAEELGRNILQTLAEPMMWKDQILRASLSVGLLVVNPGDETSVDALLRKADVALYEAKARGKNTSVIYSALLETGRAVARQIVEDVGVALETGQLELFYQPKILLQDLSLQGFEALLRWRKPDGTIVAGEAMAAAFTDFKLSRAIGEFVTTQAIAQARAWMLAGFPAVNISLNLATSQLINPDFAQDLIQRLTAAELPPSRIGLEVTETVIMSHKPEQVIANLQMLKQHGVRISLDDFGTGYASLTHLRQLPVDEIKIDKSFIRRMTTHMEDTAIVQSLISLARNLGLEVVAEGIEKVRETEYLAALGCEIGQGYHFAKPMPVDAAQDWMSARLSRDTFRAEAVAALR